MIAPTASGAQAPEPEMTSGLYLNLDSHADAAVLGNNCHIFQSTGRFVTVYGYDIALPLGGTNARLCQVVLLMMIITPVALFS